MYIYIYMNVKKKNRSIVDIGIHKIINITALYDVCLNCDICIIGRHLYRCQI